jgi:tetraacyldisaccharide 4'-kinase
VDLATDSKTNDPIDRLTRMVNNVIHGPPTGRSRPRAGLRAAAFVFEAIVRLRAQYYQRCRQQTTKLPCRVVSIGNLALGGTGKTPLCVYLARLMHDAGYRVAILSRGYRGRAEKTGAVVDTGEAPYFSARRCGDEPALMARLLEPRPIPILVGRDRRASGWRAIRRFRSEIILMDDGFQHHRLERDLDIVLLDGQHPLGNGYLLPRGPLREPPQALARSDMLVLTRCPAGSSAQPLTKVARRLVRIKPDLAAKPLFASCHRPVARERLTCGPGATPQSRPFDLGTLKGLPVLAFAGLARSPAFRQTLIDLGVDLRAWHSFRDHHPYQAAEIDSLTREGCQRGARALVTTDKDRIRLRAAWLCQLPLLVIGVDIDFGRQAQGLRQMIFKRLDLHDRREACR